MPSVILKDAYPVFRLTEAKGQRTPFPAAQRI